MFKNKKILAIIPARSGSKKIKNKNIIEIKKKPLIYYSIVEAIKSKYIDEICLSTDSVKIQSISKSFGLNSFFLRPKILSTDSALTKDVVLHALNKSENFFEKSFDYIVLLQPTCPLRKAHHVDEAIIKIINNNQNSLISVCDVEGYHPNRMKIIQKNLLYNYTQNKAEDMTPRQKLPKVYIRNGAIYISKVNFLKKNKVLTDTKSVPYIMKQTDSINIDGPVDLELAKALLK
tara:strand:- start:122 stop:820 length:699 start_codon:yes stop_codon:yes gene_type:complete